MDLGLLWSIADTFTGLMSIPNLLALLLLSGKMCIRDSYTSSIKLV